MDEFITAYGPKLKVTLECDPEGAKTLQSFKDECDINNIMARFQKDGVIDHVAKYAPVYGEVSQQDFAESMRVVTHAQSMFNELPSSAREFFNHDPGEFLDYVDDMKDNPNAAQDMWELGLSKRPPADRSATSDSAEKASSELPVSSEEAGPIDPT